MMYAGFLMMVLLALSSATPLTVHLCSFPTLDQCNVAAAVPDYGLQCILRDINLCEKRQDNNLFTKYKYSEGTYTLDIFLDEACSVRLATGSGVSGSCFVISVCDYDIILYILMLFSLTS
jgi:hypothetical protein